MPPIKLFPTQPDITKNTYAYFFFHTKTSINIIYKNKVIVKKKAKASVNKASSKNLGIK